MEFERPSLGSSISSTGRMVSRNFASSCMSARTALVLTASASAECMLQREAVVQAEPVVECLLQIDPPRIEPVYIKVRELQPALFSQLLDVGHAPGVYLRLRRADPRDK